MQIRDLAVQVDATKAQARALRMAARGYMAAGETVMALSATSRSSDIYYYLFCKNPYSSYFEYAAALNTQSNIQYDLQEYDLSLSTAQSFVDILEEFGSTSYRDCSAIAMGYSNLGNKQWNAGFEAEALRSSKCAVERYERLYQSGYSYDSAGLARACHCLSLRLGDSNPTSALCYARRATSIHTSFSDKKGDLEFAAYLGNRAWMEAQLGYIEKAQNSYSAALEEVFTALSQNLSANLNNAEIVIEQSVNFFLDQFEITVAKRVITRAEKLLIRHRQKNLFWLNLQILKARIQKALGDLEAAIIQLEPIFKMPINESIGPNQSAPPLSKAQFLAIECHLKLGDVNAALNITQALTASMEKCVSTESNSTRQSKAKLNFLHSEALLSKSDHNTAKDAISKSITLYRDLLDSNDSSFFQVDLGGALIHLGRVQNGLGDLEGAQNSYLEAFSILKHSSCSGAMHTLNQAIALANLSEALNALNDHVRAEVAARDAIDLFGKLNQDQCSVIRPHYASALNNLSIAVGKQGKARESVEIAESAAEQFSNPELFSPEQKINQASCLVNLSTSLWEDNRRLDSIRVAREAVKLFHSLRNTRSRSDHLLADALSSLSAKLLESGSLEDGISASKEACDIFTALDKKFLGQCFGLQHINALSNLAAATWMLDQTKASYVTANVCPIIRQAWSIAHRYRSEWISPQTRRKRLSSLKNFYELAASVFASAVNTDTSISSEKVDLLRIVEEFRAWRLTEKITLESSLLHRIPATEQDDFRALLKSHLEVETKISQLRNIIIKPDASKEIRSTFSELVTKANNIERAIWTCQKKYSHVAQPFDFFSPELGDHIEKALQAFPGDVIGVEFFSYELELIVIAFTKKSIVVKQVSFESFSLESWGNDWHRSYGADRTSGNWHASIPDRLQEIEQHVLPLLLNAVSDLTASERTKFTNLAIFPHLSLHMVPWSALRLNENEYLCDEWAICTAPSLCSFSIPQSDQSTKHTSSEFAIFDPTKDLPFSRAESHRMCTHFPRVRKLVGDAAAMDTILAESCDSTYWYYSGHSDSNIFRKNEEPCLKLAGEEVLSLSTIVKYLELSNCKVVTLNGCESGLLLPDAIDSGESIASAFQFAGSKVVISSYWLVSDLAAALLMDKFHQNLSSSQRTTSAESLRDAMLWLREIKSVDELRRKILPEFLAGIEDSHLLSQCSRQVEALAEQENDEGTPFVGVQYWAAFTAEGNGF